MQYTEGQIGRVFVVRIDDGEDMLLALRQFILDRDIRAGSIHFLGALMNGRMVTGPEEPVIPPVPHFVMFEGGWEVFGIRGRGRVGQCLGAAGRTVGKR